LMYFTLRVEKEQYNTAQLKKDLDTWDGGGSPVYPAAAPADTSNAAFCSSCGTKRSGASAYCTKCGAAFGPDTPPKPKDDSGSNDGPFIK